MASALRRARRRTWRRGDAPLKAYVLNLDRSPDRLAHMRAEFDRAGMKFERVIAVDGTKLPEEELEAFRRARTASRPEGWLPGQVGCFQSHSEAWRRIASGDDAWGAVFEDDVRVSPDLQPLLASADWIPDGADVVRLEANRSMRLSHRQPIRATPSRAVYKAIGGTYGAAAYILSKDAAQRLLDVPPELHTGVDLFLFRPKVSRVAKSLRRYQVVPAVCVQGGLPEGRQVLKSTIRNHAPSTVFGRGYCERSHPLLRMWPIRKLAVPFSP